MSELSTTNRTGRSNGHGTGYGFWAGCWSRLRGWFRPRNGDSSLRETIEEIIEEIEEVEDEEGGIPAITNDERVMLSTAWSLFKEGNLPDKPVRLIGVGISSWSDKTAAQADLFEQPEQLVQDRKDQKILDAIDTVTEKFGKPILQVGLSRKK